VDVEVVVVGAGLAGLVAARDLVARGHSVVVQIGDKLTIAGRHA